jgi:HK97 family phage major capsid protein
MSIQALRDERAESAKAVRELVNKKDWNPANDQSVYDQHMAKIDDLDKRIENINRVNAKLAEEAVVDQVVEGAERLAKDKKSEGALVFAKWARGGVANLNTEETAAFRRHQELGVRNDMSTGTGSEGGYTVASEVAKSVIESLKAFGGMRKVATVLQTQTGNSMSFPTSDGTAEEGEIVDENAQAGAQDPSFGAVGLPVFKYSSKVIAVPFELLMDSSIDVEAFIRLRQQTRLGRITNRHHTVGTGSSQPNGLMTAIGVGKQGASGQTGTIIYDDLVDLQHSVDPAYREGGKCGFMMADSSLKVIRKLKDLEGRPIFVPGYSYNVPGGMPDEILGSPITINQSVAAMAASAKSIAFGDLSKYVIRDVVWTQMFRFTDSKYSEKGQVGFLTFIRSGGNMTDTGAAKAYQNAAS